MRICLVSYKFLPIVGGAEVRAEKLAYQLQSLGHEVIVVTLRIDKLWKREEVLDGVSVVRVGGAYGKRGQLRLGRLGHFPIDIALFLTLWRLRHHYDVIHALQVTSCAAVAALFGKITHKPVVISSQNAGPSEIQLERLKHGARLMAYDNLNITDSLKVDYKKWITIASDITSLPKTALGGRAMLNFLKKSNAFYQALSTRAYSHLISNGFRPEQIVYIPGSVDTEKFRPLPDRRPDPASPERHIICVSRLEYSKGIDVLLNAWERVMSNATEKRTDLKPHLYLVGKGMLRPKFEYIVRKLGIQGSVEFLGLRKDVIEQLQKSWGFVLPSRWEGMSNALLEAMACGLPCVATRVSGSEDMIADGINGLLVEPEQPAQMAQSLLLMIENADLAQRLGQEARRTAIRNYELSDVVNQCVELYRLLLSSGNVDIGEVQRKEVYC